MDNLSQWQCAISAQTFQAAYVPSLQKAVHALQDADACLLGGRAHEGNSAAMGYHREAMTLLRRLPGAK